MYNRFRIVKNLNEMVMSRVRVDEEKRLLAEGQKQEAQPLKGPYILNFWARYTGEDGSEGSRKRGNTAYV